MSLTVAVATYGRPEDLARCLAALAEQTLAPDEVLVVDQAPGDAARAVTKASGLPRIRYVEQPPLGLSASRNLALDTTGADVLVVTDDDCMPASGWLAALADALARSPEPAAVSGAVLPPPGEPPQGGVAVSTRAVAERADFAGPVLPWRVGTGANLAARVGRLRAVGGWDERLGAGSPGRAGEDTDLLYRLLRAGARVRVEPTAVVHHAWQTAERRHATRSSYAFGIGAMCGLHLRRRDPYALRMLVAYGRMQARGLAGGLRANERLRAAEHLRALGAIGPGVGYGLTAGGAARRW